ncbi:hypothetical protein ABIA35_004300 [Catenulispora sp. MAP12-49]
MSWENLVNTFSVRRVATAVAAAAFASSLAVAATGCAGHTAASGAPASSNAAVAGAATSSSVDAPQTAGTSAAASPSSAPGGAASSNPVKPDAVQRPPTASSAAHPPPAGPTPSASGQTSTAPKPSVPQPPPPIPPSSLPDAAIAAWQPMGSLVAMNVPAHRGIGVGECLMVDGAAAWHEQGYISAQQTPAQEDIFSFADAATAAKAYQSMVGAMGACQQLSRSLQSADHLPADAAVTPTGRGTQAQAWSRSWTGVPGQSMAGPQINHYYLVQRGATVIVAAFTETGSGLAHPYDTSGDPAVLTMLTAHAGS